LLLLPLLPLLPSLAMDYAGQALCEQLYQLILLLAGLIGFGLGYKEQSFWLTFLWCCGGFVVATLVCVPDWPIYRKHPLPWQPHQPLLGEKDVSGQTVQDTNVHCGTCACGTQVHGVNCESHPDFNAEADAEEEDGQDAATNAAAAPTGKASAAALDAASKPEKEGKAKSGKKSKQ